MRTNTRFIKSIIKAAAQDDTALPWKRGTTRAAFIAKRTASLPARKTA
ncbi:MAG: hypothetical protein V7763_12955 [Sulfitobacter sp.]|jgi:hypothetical protein|tara:strand:- start:2859 stop:3002 length:144 start_codon:yes stop_codon:yes gene_type:complete